MEQLVKEIKWTAVQTLKKGFNTRVEAIPLEGRLAAGPAATEALADHLQALSSEESTNFFIEETV